jgi:hypothetical protein
MKALDTRLALTDCKPLWRYLRLNTLFLHLQGKSFFPSITKLQDCDAKEGCPICQTEWIIRKFPDSDWQEIAKWICTPGEKANIEANIVKERYFDFINQTRFAWCWYQSNYESAAMWQLYGRGGVAVKSSAARLTTVLKSQQREFMIGRVAYFDRAGRPLDCFDPEKPENKELILRPYFVKGVEYTHENEVRIVTTGGFREGRKGIVLSGLTPEKWIEEIAIWPGLPSNEECAIREAIKKFCPQLNVRTRRSELYERDPGAAETEAALDAHYDEKIDPCWSDGSDGIPQLLKRL